MTFWLGLRLSLRGGREAAVRLALVAAAVAMGVTVLLSTVALFNAFRVTAERPCWECTTGSAPAGWALGATQGAALWNHRQDSYAGRPIERLDVAVLDPAAPAPAVPGVPALPAAGRFYVSPALAELMAAVPREQLADRFPGARAGLVGRAALSGPDDLVAVVGRTPGELAGMAGTVAVDTVATFPAAQDPAADDLTALYEHGFGIAAIGLIVPLLVLVGTATRLAAARREARFAAVRLAGATARQINAIASADAALGALLGALAGVALFQAVRPALAGVAITGSRFFPDVVTPTAPQYAIVIAGVPLAAAAAAVWSLRRVRITPLGAARRTRASAPGWWRVLPLLAGLGLFAGPAFAGGGREPDPLLADAGLALIMVGLMVAGPWLTMLAARLAARLTRGAATLLAARRLAAEPKAAFRSVNGIVLAVFIGTAVAGIVPAVVSGQLAAGDGTLNEVMRVPFGYADAAPGRPLPPGEADELLAEVGAHPGVTVLPIYRRTTTQDPPAAPLPCDPGPGCRLDFMLGHVVSCDDLARFPALGACAPGVRAVTADFNRLLTSDNLLSVDRNLPIVDPTSPSAPAGTGTGKDVGSGSGNDADSGKAGAAASDGLSLAAVLIRADDPAVRERIRTSLTPYVARSGSAETPLTFAEVARFREVLLDQVERVALAIVALTLLVAGCGLLVAVAGGVVERRQPFTLLRLSGTPTRTLSLVVVLETAVPVLLAALVAAAAGFGVAGPVIDQLAIKSAPAALPGAGYLLTVGGGLLAALLIVLAGLPLLRRVTAPDNARFE
ncbi:FtsX-like permease family protein [Nonomuraea wenchangensis]|uniref:FtsX-like permease family protein n=1 Tax=Nonomuraea wenchangensis TaxID=568860 RepID=A0A1I0L864_9ACTN|nr:FtsX-like permease family protein [Nonomuraea wenchangensis]SEU36176.1 FtsX-like permease family protein [Nonomuraea wenchangensis]